MSDDNITLVIVVAVIATINAVAIISSNRPSPSVCEKAGMVFDEKLGSYFSAQKLSECIERNR